MGHTMAMSNLLVHVELWILDEESDSLPAGAWLGGWVYQVMPESDNEEPPLSAHPSLPDPGWLLITFQFIIAVRPITG